MAEFLEVIKATNRMCDGECNKCVLEYDTNGYDMNCGDLLQEHPEEYERIVMQWASEHPIKTNADKFREVFGIGICYDPRKCTELECPPNTECTDCKFNGFWDKEYVEPKEEK